MIIHPEQFKLQKDTTEGLTRLQQNFSKQASQDDNVDDLVKQIKLFDQRERPNGTMKYSAFQSDLRGKMDDLVKAVRDAEGRGQSISISKQARVLYEHFLEDSGFTC